MELNKEFVEQIQMYARKAVQCMYILCITFEGNKDSLIRTIDEAMLDDSRIETMRHQIENGHSDFERYRETETSRCYI